MTEGFDVFQPLNYRDRQEETDDEDEEAVPETQDDQDREEEKKRFKKHNQPRRVEDVEANEEEVVKVAQDKLVQAPVLRRQNRGPQPKKWLWLTRILLFLKMVKSGPITNGQILAADI